MLDKFLQYQLYLKIDDISDDIIKRFASIVEGVHWHDGTKIDGPFIREHLNNYVCSEEHIIYWDDYVPDDKEAMLLSKFVELYTSETKKFADIDAMTVFEGMYDVNA